MTIEVEVRDGGNKMRTSLSTRVLSYLWNKQSVKREYIERNDDYKTDRGFTLIELLVAIVIIGILGSISYPSMLGQVNKAKQAEAKMNVGAIVRGQQIYYLEAGRFATALADLAMGIQVETQRYRYAIATNDNRQNAVNGALPKESSLRAYLGLVGLGFTEQTHGDLIIVSKICESNKPVTITDSDLQNLVPNGGGAEIACDRPTLTSFQHGFRDLR